MITLLLYTVAPILVAAGGDKILDKTRNYVLRSLIDSLTHGLVGLLSWVVLINRSATNRGYILSINFEVILCGVLASAIDLDHFVAARSFSLRDALNLGIRRAPLHSTSLLFAVVFPMLAIGKVLLKKGVLLRLGLLVLVAVGSHHIRDGIDIIEKEVYWFAGVLLVLVIVLFLLVVALFVKHSRLKRELLMKVKEIHKFNVPYIDPKEDLAKRGYAQYPQRSIALQH